MKNFLTQAVMLLVSGSIVSSVAMAHETGLAHHHNFLELLAYSLMQPDHLLILIGVALVVFLQVQKSERK